VNRLVRITSQVVQPGRQRVLRRLAWDEWQEESFRLASKPRQF
jgi:hypothetical protein